MKLKTIPLDTQRQPFATVFQSFRSKGLQVPKPLELMTASDSLFDTYMKIIHFYFTHPTFSSELMASIRYAVAAKNDFLQCVEFNRDVLELHGVSEGLEYLDRLEPLPILSEKETFLFRFAVDALFYPARIDAQRIAAAHSAGINDAELLEVSFHGGLLLMMGPLVKALG